MYWVTKEPYEYIILTDAWCAITGNHYVKVAGGFRTEEAAEKVVKLMNDGKNEKVDIDGLIIHTDPKEELLKQGYILKNKRWVTTF